MAESRPADPVPPPGTLPPGASSDAQPAPAAPLSVGTQRSAAPSGSTLRKVLYVLFVLTVVGLGYDQWARHEARSACEVVEAAIENQTPENRLNSVAVRQLLARDPDDTLSDESSDREIYRWRGTLLSYDVTVEYSKEGELRDVRLGGQ